MQAAFAKKKDAFFCAATPSRLEKRRFHAFPDKKQYLRSIKKQTVNARRTTGMPRMRKLMKKQKSH